jgi:rhomboid protease GluP
MVTVRRCARKRQAQHYAFVLTAVGIRSHLVWEGGETAIQVIEEDAERARDELAAYDGENAKPRYVRKPWPGTWPRIEVTMAYWAVLLFFFAAEGRHAFSVDWVEIGAMQAGLMRAGEWWRAVTAITLHVDFDHLIGNLAYGTAIGILLSRLTGPGVAWLSMVAAGAVANTGSALLQSTDYSAIGASTAIFAGIGTLATLRQVHEPLSELTSMRTWAPLAGGITLLVYLGLSGENTDILGHVLGFVAGIAGGVVLAALGADRAEDMRLQWKCAAATLAILAGAWALALASTAPV